MFLREQSTYSRLILGRYSDRYVNRQSTEISAEISVDPVRYSRKYHNNIFVPPQKKEKLYQFLLRHRVV